VEGAAAECVEVIVSGFLLCSVDEYHAMRPIGQILT
jgi:hypothetical protein